MSVKTLALPAQTKGPILVIVPSLFLFSQKEQEHPLVFWMLLNEFRSSMNEGRLISLPRKPSKVLFCFAFDKRSDIHKRYMNFLRNQDLGPVQNVTMGDVHRLIRRLPVPDLFDTPDVVLPRIEMSLAIIIRIATCGVFGIETEDFLILPNTAPAKMAATLTMRQRKIEFAEISMVCKMSTTEAQISAVLADMKISKDREFKQNVGRIGLRCS